MLLAISGIFARIPAKGKMAHALHCSYSVRIVKGPSQILLTTAAQAGKPHSGLEVQATKWPIVPVLVMH